jgi:hypothetical protein
MSPQRPSFRGSSTSKPYTRGSSSPTPSIEDQKEFAQLEYPHTPDIDEDGQAGFPTRAQYQIIERGYIKSLTPRRQGKALISQALFDRIWDVLHSADNVKENAQFRFWARKMFTLSKSHTLSLGVNGSHPVEQEVLLHDGLLVAVREQIYDLLCFCHGSTNHGGRDKTCALIRKHYTWVPKDLVAQFIKACPTCILKKCGHAEPGLLSPGLGTSAGSPTIQATPFSAEDATKQEPISPHLPSFRDYFIDVDGTDGPPQDPYPNSLPSTPLHGPHSQFLFNSDHIDSSTPIEQLKRYNQLTSVPSPLPGYPMTRELSLYEGLPDGWQYQNVDYRNAHADCVEYQRMASILPYDPSLGRTRPRMPEIAPLFKADFEDYINYRADETDEGSFSFIPTTTAAAGMSPQIEDYHSHSHSQQISPTIGDENVELPIDPLLLALSASMHSQLVDYGSPGNSREIPLSDILHTESDADMSSPSPAGLSSPFAPAATAFDTTTNDIITGPPASKPESLDSVKTFREFLSFRDSFDSGLNSSLAHNHDDGNIVTGLWRENSDGNESGDSSPANSVRSNVSGLSLVASGLDGVVLGVGAAGSPASTTGTPITTAPVTPVDEVTDENGGLVGVGVGGVDGTAGKEKEKECVHCDEDENGELEGMDLNAVIQAVSICDVQT